MLRAHVFQVLTSLLFMFSTFIEARADIVAVFAGAAYDEFSILQSDSPGEELSKRSDPHHTEHYRGVSTRLVAQVYPISILGVDVIGELGLQGRNFRAYGQFKAPSGELSFMQTHAGIGLGVDMALLHLQGVIGAEHALEGSRYISGVGQKSLEGLNGVYATGRVLLTVAPFLRVGAEVTGQWGTAKFAGAHSRDYDAVTVGLVAGVSI